MRSIGGEHYVNGKAHLEWHLSLIAGGRWYVLHLVAKKVDRRVDPDLRLPETMKIPASQMPSGRYADQEAMLVYQIQFIETDQSIIPSRVGLKVEADLKRPLSSLPGLFLDYGLYPISCLADRKVGALGRSAACDRTCAHNMIERGAKIMHSVTDQKKSQSNWRALFESDLETGLPRLKVLHDAYSIGLCAEIPENGIVKFSKVSLRALNLQ